MKSTVLFGGMKRNFVKTVDCDRCYRAVVCIHLRLFCAFFGDHWWNKHIFVQNWLRVHLPKRYRTIGQSNDIVCVLRFPINCNKIFFLYVVAFFTFDFASRCFDGLSRLFQWARFWWKNCSSKVNDKGKEPKKPKEKKLNCTYLVTNCEFWMAIGVKLLVSFRIVHWKH